MQIDVSITIRASTMNAASKSVSSVRPKKISPDVGIWISRVAAPTSVVMASSTRAKGESGTRRGSRPNRIPAPIPTKLAISRKLRKKPMCVTFAGIHRIRTSSTNRITALVRNSRTAGRWRGRTGFAIGAASQSIAPGAR